MLGCFSLLLVLQLASAECDTSCTLGLVESIPENLTYPSGSPSFPSTYQAWSRLLDSAKEYVNIGSFYWSLRTSFHDTSDKEGLLILEKLVSTAARGVEIRVVQNVPTAEFPDNDTRFLKQIGAAEVYSLNFTELDNTEGVLHTKLLVVDGKHFYVGSANMDWRSLTQVKELGVLGMDCECLAQDAEKLFEVYLYLGVHQHLPDTWSDFYSAKYNMSHPADVKINGTPASAFWASSPPEFCAKGRTGDIDALLNVIRNAKEFVYVAVMDYFPAFIYTRPHTYWDTIDKALREASYNRGVRVRVLGSCWSHTNRDMWKFLESLSALNRTGSFNGIIETRFFIVPKLENKSIPYTRVNHNKYMVSDNAAYIGTSNWSGDYFTDTGGVSLTVNQTSSPSPLHGHAPKSQQYPPSASVALQEQLRALFERDWDSPYAKNHPASQPCTAYL